MIMTNHPGCRGPNPISNCLRAISVTMVPSRAEAKQGTLVACVDCVACIAAVDDRAGVGVGATRQGVATREGLGSQRKRDGAMVNLWDLHPKGFTYKSVGFLAVGFLKLVWIHPIQQHVSISLMCSRHGSGGWLMIDLWIHFWYVCVVIAVILRISTGHCGWHLWKRFWWIFGRQASCFWLLFSSFLTACDDASFLVTPQDGICPEPFFGDANRA